MQAKPECYICNMKQVLKTAARITADPVLQKKVLYSAMDFLQKSDFETTPPELGSDLYHLLCQELNAADPFRPEMDDYNRQALNLYPQLQQILARSGDRVYQALLMAVAGNLIDLGIIDSVNVAETLHAVLRTGLKIDDYAQFKELLPRAGNLLYIADNAGEIVFDRLLLEEIHRSYPAIRLIVAVKSGPAVNDALCQDAVAAGIEPLAEIIETGAACQGIPEQRCQPEFLRRFATADLIIAKGHANFETMIPGGRAVFVLLRAKCKAVSAELGVAVHDSVFKKLW